ncbi:MAG: hypothetical protein R3E89_08575 [Thiolinea sp.]
MSLVLLLFTVWMVSVAQAADPAESAATRVTEPGIDLWDAVRGRDGVDAGQVRTQVRGVDSTVLINAGGEDWREYRMDLLIPNAAMILGGVALAILLFRLIRGKIRIRAGRSRYKIKRFNGFQRFIHWTTAILFVLLALTGMALLFGRFIVIPNFGPEAGGTFMFLSSVSMILPVRRLPWHWFCWCWPLSRATSAGQ